MDQIKVSVIIPIYKVEKYLDKCILSVIHQTYSNLEIILVDDGSTDEVTIKICNQLAKEHENVFLFCKPNGGSASARNYGIKQARGKYIGFVDSDDIIDRRMYSTLYSIVKRDSVSVAICGISTEANGKIEFNFDILESGIYYNNNLMHHFLLGVWHSACTCLYDKTLFEKVQFPEGEVNEDYIFNYHIFKNVDKVSFVKTPLYHYLLREGSNTGSPKTLKFIDWINHTKFILDEQSNNPNLLQEAEYQYIYSNIVLSNSSLLTLSEHYFKEANELYKITARNLFECKNKILGNKYLSKRNRFMGIFIAYLPNIYKYLILLFLKFKYFIFKFNFSRNKQ